MFSKNLKMKLLLKKRFFDLKILSQTQFQIDSKCMIDGL
jgi:hypothetical protein